MAFINGRAPGHVIQLHGCCFTDSLVTVVRERVGGFSIGSESIEFGILQQSDSDQSADAQAGDRLDDCEQTPVKKRQAER